MARKLACLKCTVKMQQIFWKWRILFFQIPCPWTTKALLESQGIDPFELIREQNSFERQIGWRTKQILFKLHGRKVTFDSASGDTHKTHGLVCTEDTHSVERYNLICFFSDVTINFWEQFCLIYKKIRTRNFFFIFFLLFLLYTHCRKSLPHVHFVLTTL